MARSRVSKLIALPTHADALRASLLLSLGLSPLACGGTALTTSNGDGGSSAQAGANAQGGTNPVGGMTSGGAGSTGGTGSPRSCENPTVSPVTKLTNCSNGLSHRAEATACTYTSPPPPSAGGEGGGGGEASAGGSTPCTGSADCSTLLRGYCEFGGDAESVCRSGCLTDADCGGGVCLCDGTSPGRCTSGDCHVDADCGKDAFCAPVPPPPGCGSPVFRCVTLQDECSTDADCAPLDRDCRVQIGRRTCVDTRVCGRPFLVAEAPRLAATAARADWLDTTLIPDSSNLTPIERAQLSAYWARLGQMEHASIAAFARFSLQLLSLGAPSRLVEACNRALADETAHARSCFALASAYGGTAVGPAPLDIEHCFDDPSLTGIAKLVLREGCLGETVAALEAVAAAECAVDPAVQRALTRIARDEQNHTGLAFQFLRWALSVSSPEVRRELAREAAQRLADFENSAQQGERSATDQRLAAHGLLGTDALRDVHLAAVRDVSRPLLAALFDFEASKAASAV